MRSQVTSVNYGGDVGTKGWPNVLSEPRSGDVVSADRIGLGRSNFASEDMHKDVGRDEATLESPRMVRSIGKQENVFSQNAWNKAALLHHRTPWLQQQSGDHHGKGAALRNSTNTLPRRTKLADQPIVHNEILEKAAVGEQDHWGEASDS